MRYKLHVDLARQELSVLDRDNVIITTPCSAGCGIASKYGQGTTPTGCYRVSDITDGREEALLVDPSGKWNPYGPFVANLDIPGRRISIHGTDELEKLGTPVSAGCIRISNDTLLKFVNCDVISIGTLVEIIGGADHA